MTQDIHELKKSQKHHIRCAVCGKSCVSVYDEDLKAFPIYHTQQASGLNYKCEDRFYEALLRIYTFLHKQNQSMSMNDLVNRFQWLDLVIMRKEMLAWCMNRGFLTVDGLKRVEIPSSVENNLSNLFESTNLDDPDNVEVAVEIVKGALRNLNEDLEPVPHNEMPIKTVELDLGDSTIFENIDTRKVPLKRDEKKGMVTASRTGADDLERRSSTASSTMARRRLEDDTK